MNFLPYLPLQIKVCYKISCNIQEISNICYILKCKDINRQISKQECFSKQDLWSNKTRKTRDGYRGQTQQPQYWKQRQEQYWGHWLMESCLSSQVNYCTSALYPGEKPDLEILSSSFMKLLKVTLGQSQTTLNRI